MPVVLYVTKEGRVFKVSDDGSQAIYAASTGALPKLFARLATAEEAEAYKQWRDRCWSLVIQNIGIAVKAMLASGWRPRPNSDDMEEALSAIGMPSLLRAADNWHSNGGASYSTYAWRVVKNAMGDKIRRKIRSKVLVSIEAHDLDFPAEESAEQSQPYDVQRLMNGLSPYDAMLLLARYWNGLTYEDIGDMAGISKGTAWNHIQLALTHAKVVLSSHKLQSDKDGAESVERRH